MGVRHPDHPADYTYLHPPLNNEYVSKKTKITLRIYMYTIKALHIPLQELDMNWNCCCSCLWRWNFSNAKLSRLSAWALSRSSWY
jgi:hypothetical protein